MRQHQDSRGGAGDTRLCERARARARGSVRVTVSAHGGGREGARILKRRGGICAGGQRQTIVDAKLRSYQRTAKGTGKRISGIDLQ